MSNEKDEQILEDSEFPLKEDEQSKLEKNVDSLDILVINHVRDESLDILVINHIGYESRNEGILQPSDETHALGIYSRLDVG